MIDLIYPCRGALHITHLVTDVNGTLAMVGILIDGFAKSLTSLRDRLEFQLLTDDTPGCQAAIEELLKLKTTHVQPGNEEITKADFVRMLGAETVVAIGQGANSTEAMRAAEFEICVMFRKAVPVETLVSADIVVPNVFTTLDLLEKPLRIVASLRK